ncbi:MAG: carboxypeptidase-like regulatory domain-containing protein, partial [Crocinitomicaceae bacterium]|nr:carboxypeptidase-like regulatory domain-containing protein [Crocinitomicaceae bacterium]
MFRTVLLLIFCFILSKGFTQQTEVYGKITDKETKKPLPFVKVKFKNSKIGTISDSLGNYSLSTYYATDSLLFILPSYKYIRRKIKLDTRQELNVILEPALTEINEVVVRPPDELPSTILHKKIIANKPINNKTKLIA